MFFFHYKDDSVKDADFEPSEQSDDSIDFSDSDNEPTSIGSLVDKIMSTNLDSNKAVQEPSCSKTNQGKYLLIVIYMYVLFLLIFLIIENLYFNLILSCL